MKLTTTEQKRKLAEYEHSFAKTIRHHNQLHLSSYGIKVIQINVGKICNQACHHCHVDASPIRTETMEEDIAQQCVELIKNLDQAHTVDITGGAPEINKHFKYLVRSAKQYNKHVIDRCNLTILEEKKYEDLYDFLKEQEVEIIASLPHYSAMRTDQQRGKGVFETSITALKKLNAMGYGKQKQLPLNLVYNPSGSFLSGAQEQLEREFKEQLYSRYQIVFNNLYCMNNLPISRFLGALLRKNKFEAYMTTLKDAFNIQTMEGLMCRYQLSIGYDGNLYDCDFNQMLEIPSKPIGHLKNWQTTLMEKRTIQIGNHCYGCTAGAGSSCGGSIT